MKTLPLLLMISLLVSCTSKERCDYSTATVISYIDGKEVNTKSFKDCYTRQADKNTMSVNEIKGTQPANNIKVMYYPDASMLNVKIGEQLSEWRKNKGHDIYILKDNADSLALMFGEGTKKEKSISGTIIYSK